MSPSYCPVELLSGQAGAEITWCPECGTFNLALGHVQLRLTAAQFTQLHLLMNQAMQRVGGRPAEPEAAPPGRRRTSALH